MVHKGALVASGLALLAGADAFTTGRPSALVQRSSSSSSARATRQVVRMVSTVPQSAVPRSKPQQQQQQRRVKAPAPAKVEVVYSSSTTTSTNTRVRTTIPNARGGEVMGTWQFKVLNSLISFPLFNAILFGVYRKQMVQKAEGMGIKWTAFLTDLKEKLPKLQQMAKDMKNPALTIPDYYYAPIHAYADGNLCWDSAMEEDLWSKLMIAPLYDNSVHGDVLMRRDWLDTCKKYIGVDEVKNVIDLGCGTGLSMYMIQSTWHKAELLGVDMSTYKLAISQEKLSKKSQDVQNKVQLKHMPAEATEEPDAKYDLATICLVNHESPEQVSKDMFKEAYRVLRPGGVFTVLDLDKNNLEILLENPFVAAIYAQTEPYMEEYLKLNMPKALEETGFQLLEVRSSSPSHISLIARKPLEA